MFVVRVIGAWSASTHNFALYQNMHIPMKSSIRSERRIRYCHDTKMWGRKITQYLTKPASLTLKQVRWNRNVNISMWCPSKYNWRRVKSNKNDTGHREPSWLLCTGYRTHRTHRTHRTPILVCLVFEFGSIPGWPSSVERRLSSAINLKAARIWRHDWPRLRHWIRCSDSVISYFGVLRTYEH